MATALSTIVMVAVGGLVAGYWRVAQKYVYEEQRMREISLLSDLFRDNARTFSSAFLLSNTNRLDFGNNHALAYDDGIEGVLYDSDTTAAGAIASILDHCVVQQMFSIITTGNLVRLEVRLTERELSKTNNYSMYVMPRNNN